MSISPNFLIFKVPLWCDVVIAISQAVFLWKHIGKFTFSGDISTEFLCGPRLFLLICNLKCRRLNAMINEEENFAATHQQEQEILRDEILAAVDPLSAAAGRPRSAIGPSSAFAAAPEASIGHPCSAAANQTISKAALGKLNYLRACMVRQL